MVKKRLQMGADGPSERLPRLPAEKSKFNGADAWFLDLYQSLGEPLAEVDPSFFEVEGCVPIDDADHPLWSLRIAINNGQYAPKRYLNPGTFEDLFLMYEAMVPVGEQVSKSTLLRVWNGRWKKFLAFRRFGQGKRCKVCARIDEERLQVTTAEERAAVAQEKKNHINAIMADRAISVRTNRAAEEHSKVPSIDGDNQLLKITIDGMDQAKFRCPRNLASSAEFDSCFRPQLHMVGTICHGHFEAYFIMNTDVAKDANMNCTIISRCLDLLQQGLPGTRQERGAGTAWPSQCALPRTIVVGADNTTRESKNQTFLSFLAHLVARNMFEAAEVQFLQTGHTHNEQDQRFSSVGALLQRAPVLEDPYEFADWMHANIVPPRGRALHVEVLESTWDFQSWLFQLDAQLSGLAATHTEPDTNHVWRLVRSSMLVNVLPPEALEVEVAHSSWKSLGADDSDVVLLVQQYMHSARMSQKPLLVQPREVALKLQWGDLKGSRRNVLGERLLREYRKTAEVMGCQPWNLLKARKYLEKLCLDNETGHVPQPPVLGAVVHYQMKDIAPVAHMASDVVVQPRRVFVETPGPAEQRRRAKRVAAAAPSLDASEADTGGAPPEGSKQTKRRPAAALTSPEGETKRRPAAALTSPEGVDVRNHHGWTIQTKTRKSGNLAGQHWRIWIAPDGTKHASQKRAEAAGFIAA
jgi:hypothetical protein